MTETSTQDTPMETSRPKPPKKGHKKLYITLTALGLVAATLLGVWLYLLTPAQPKDYGTLVAPERIEQNQALYTALTAAGLGSPFVDVNDDRVLIMYEVVDGADDNAAIENMQRVAIGAAHKVAPDVGYVTVVAMRLQEPCMIWEASMADFAMYMAGESSGAEFEAKVKKDVLPQCD